MTDSHSAPDAPASSTGTSGGTVPADWGVYLGSGVPHGGITRLPDPPRWRDFDGPASDSTASANASAWAGQRPGIEDRARNYRPTTDLREMVNVALCLRRPLLITGAPGTGKSTLAHAVAYELGLGPVLYWPISSKSTLTEALYRYDPLGRLQDINFSRSTDQPAPDIGEYIQLGPLGTALVPTRTPRVVLIDEFDKCDPDLPNDLLNVLEEGQFEIPELSRIRSGGPREVRTADPDTWVSVTGLVRCHAFPFIVITSNGEQEFPAAFHRRCVRFEIPTPTEEQVELIVRSQLGDEAVEACRPLIEGYLRRLGRDEVVSADQLLNAIFLVTRGQAGRDFDKIDRQVMRSLAGDWL